jgi:DNA-binding NarL/FixJ family response regulator
MGVDRSIPVGMTIMDRPTADEVDLRAIGPSDGLETIDAILNEIPDVVVVTLEPGPIHPMRFCREVADRAPVTRVLIQAPPDQAANSYQAIRIGAWGCIDETASPSALYDAAEAAAQGEAILSARHAAWVLRELDEGVDPAPGTPPSVDRLTTTERSVLGLLVEGNDHEAIGDRLGVTARVVGRHAGSAVARLHRRYRRPSQGTGETSPAVATRA